MTVTETLLEAAWAASNTPGPLRAFYERVRARRGMLHNTVVIPVVTDAFREDGTRNGPATATALSIMLDDLASTSNAQAHARSEGELAPGVFRARAAATATQPD